VFASLQASPEGHTPARRAEVEAERRAPDERLGRPRDRDSLALVVIRPEHAVAAAGRATAGRCAVGHALERPFHRAPPPLTLDHASSSAALRTEGHVSAKRAFDPPYHLMKRQPTGRGKQ